MPHHAIKKAGHAQLVMVTVLVRSDRLSHGPRPLPARPMTPQFPLTRRHGWRCGGCGGWPVTRPLCHLHSTLGQNEDLAWPGTIPPSSLLYIRRIRSDLHPSWSRGHGKWSIMGVLLTLQPGRLWGLGFGILLLYNIIPNSSLQHKTN